MSLLRITEIIVNKMLLPLNFVQEMVILLLRWKWCEGRKVRLFV
jgi:hypothetical protein